jgi:hypothetical protein
MRPQALLIFLAGIICIFSCNSQGFTQDPDVDTSASVPEPKRLSGLEAGSKGSPKGATKSTPQPPQTGAQSKAGAQSKGGSTQRKANTVPAKSNGKPVKAPQAAPESPELAKSKASLRTVEPKQVEEHPGMEGEETFLLRYKFNPGMVIRNEVTHLAKNGTRIDSVQQDATSRTVSDKSWTVLEVSDGMITFDYRIDSIDMAQQINSGDEIRYSSAEPSQDPPLQFVRAAESVGKIVSTIRIDERGLVVARSDVHNPPHMGMGDVTVPLPEAPVSVGATWEIPREMRIDRKDGNFRLVKFREFFKLEKVSAGVATISVRSEPLSTIAEPSEEAQVLQQLSNGTIRFDIDAGRMISKELAWDHQVVAFSGAGSVLEYSARLDDHEVTIEAQDRTAKAKSSPTTSR